MNIYRILSSILFVFLSFSVCSQEYKFGDVSIEELKERIYPNDSSASAAVLFRTKRIRFEYNQGMGFKVITSVYERLKIYNKDGFEYATRAEKLYRNGGDKESISGLKAFTYNLENGEIVKYKLNKSGIFNTSISKYRDEEKFTLPNVREGSVIEFEYEIHSPFYYNIDEVVFQYDIPIKKQEIMVSTPEYFVFKPFQKGYLMIQPKHSSSSGTINLQSRQRSDGYVATTSFSSSTINYGINIVEYNMQDVPALKEEPFVNYMDNYRSAVKYELQFVKFPNEPMKSYTTSWESVIKNIYKSEAFGEQLKSNRFFKDDLEALVSDQESKMELVYSIFKHVQDRMTWNKYFGYYVDKGVKEAYKEKSGNIADINLILLAMLQEAGLDANPVLVSTRSNGIPLFPTMEGFNYVIAAVQTENGKLLLDASDKYSKPGLLPIRALNWYGRLVKKDETYETIDLSPVSMSKEVTNMMVELSTEGHIQGKFRKVYDEYDAYIFRKNNISIAEDDYLEKLENKNSGMEISEYELKNKKSLNKSIIESYAFELDDQADVINDKMYFSPLFFMAMAENPFKLEERKYPIDFSYPWQERYTVIVNIPDSFQVISKPEDISLAMPDNLGNFSYQINNTGKSIQLSVNLIFNKAIVGVEYYNGLKEFYKKVVEKQTEKIVLSKSRENVALETIKAGE